MAKVKVDQALLRAQTHLRKGEIKKARTLYLSVLQAFPQNSRAREALAKLNDVHPAPDTPTNPPQDQIDALIALYKQGFLGPVIKQATALTSQYPRSFLLWNILGAAHKGQGQLQKAEQGFSTAAKLNPNARDVFHNLGTVRLYLGKLDEAISAFQHALELMPDFAEARFGLANSLNELGRLDEAIAAYHHFLSDHPDHATAHNNLGNALRAQSTYDDAIKAFQRALDINPDFAEAHNNIGVAHKDNGNLQQALTSFERAIAIEPDYAIAYNNKGIVLDACGREDEAIAAFERALEINPDYAKAHYHIGNVHRSQDKLNAAIAAFQRALDIQPDFAEAEVKLRHQLQNICDWDAYAHLKTECQHLGTTTTEVFPFAMLSMEDNAERQMQRSQKWARANYNRAPLSLPDHPTSKPERLRIGYFSPDFYNHPCLYLMLGMLLNHDRSRFEIHVYSYSQTKTGQLRQRAVDAVDRFIDIADMADGDVADLARTHQLDIAIDLTGYTNNSRSGLFQFGLAPIQMNYLGYPGTMGADFIDYIVADPTVIPDEQRPFYTEKMITLPHSYLPNDNTLEIARNPGTRVDHNLPENAFVFCCFNNNYKISPREFDIWMRALDQIDNSVLWLLKSNTWSGPNLRKHAAARGIDPARIIFAGKVPHSEHLARHRHADLFLDTFNYNAHTTASEALWAGLPVVTKIGEQFAARVAASLLTSIGLPELITSSEQEYEALILDLATDRDRLSAIRDTLATNRLTQPLFDTKQNTRAFEDGLRQAYDLWFRGTAPQDIRVKAKQR